MSENEKYKKYNFNIDFNKDENIVDNKREKFFNKEVSVWKRDKIVLSNEMKAVMCVNSAVWIFFIIKKKDTTLALGGLLSNLIIVSFGLTKMLD
jgi:hypothetical protein